MRRWLWTALLLGATTSAEAQGLRIGMRDDPDILDPTFSRTYVGTVVMTALCDKLFDFDERLNIVPVLATGYEWTDPTHLLIRLRPGVVFHNGEPLDAEAVRYSLTRHATAPGSFRRAELGAMDRVDVVDPLTVRVTMKQPFAPFIAILTDRAGMMVAPKAAEAAGKEFGLRPVCAGPFRFTERVAQDRVVLERAPNYWDPARIHLGRVTYRIIPDSSIRLANLRAGALDLTEIAPLDVAAAQADPKLAVSTAPSLGYGALTINLAGATPMAKDARIRHAFELAIDREALIQVVFAGLYQPNAQATAAASPLHADLPVPARDPARARALLAEAGVTAPMRVDLLVYNTPQGVQAGEVIQSMVAEAGFDVRVQAAEFGTVLAAVLRGEYQVTLGGWSGLLDPDSNSYAFLHTGSLQNVAKYESPAADALLEQSRAEPDPARRRALFRQLFARVQADLPMIYLWTPRNILGASRKVAGVRLLADGLLRLQDVRLSP